jgi:hypothetical protein
VPHTIHKTSEGDAADHDPVTAMGVQRWNMTASVTIAP